MTKSETNRLIRGMYVCSYVAYFRERFRTRMPPQTRISLEARRQKEAKPREGERAELLTHSPGTLRPTMRKGGGPFELYETTGHLRNLIFIGLGPAAALKIKLCGTFKRAANRVAAFASSGKVELTISLTIEILVISNSCEWLRTAARIALFCSIDLCDLSRCRENRVHI